MVTQTVGFELEIHFNRCESEKAPLLLVFHSFEKMINRYYKERKRRALKDRATSGKYRMFLTDHGKQACRNDADCRARHKDAIDGKWLDM